MAALLLIERNERRPPWTTAFAFREAQICRVKRNGRRFYEFPPAKSYSMQYRFVYRGSYKIIGRLENNRQRRMRDVFQSDKVFEFLSFDLDLILTNKKYL